MSNIIFCPKCGTSMEGSKNCCPCCGTTVNESQGIHNSQLISPPQQNTNGIPPYNQNQFGQQNGPFMQQPQFGQMPPNPLQYENYNQYQKNDGVYQGCAVTGMILGILSIIMCCTFWFDIILGIAGLVLSIIGLKSKQGQGFSIAGICCSIAGMLFAIVMTVSLFLE